MTRRAVILRRRRAVWYWALGVVFVALLVREIVDGPAYRAVLAGVVVVVWGFLYRDWIEGGLR